MDNLLKGFGITKWYSDRLNETTLSVLSICQVKTEYHRINSLKYSSESNRILHNGTVRVFVKTTHGLTQKKRLGIVNIEQNFAQIF